MHVITNREHIDKLVGIETLLPVAYITYLTSEFDTLAAALNDDDNPFFSLASHGHRMVAVFGHDNLDLLETWPEYVELVELSDDVSVYRACLMPDNECFELVYALRGALEPSVEQWFAEQAEIGQFGS